MEIKPNMLCLYAGANDTKGVTTIELLGHPGPCVVHADGVSVHLICRKDRRWWRVDKPVRKYLDVAGKFYYTDIVGEPALIPLSDPDQSAEREEDRVVEIYSY